MTRNAILIHLSETKSVCWGAFHHQTAPQKVFTALWAVETEVNNGGFAQYFFNTANETVSFVIEALYPSKACQAPKLPTGTLQAT